LIMRLHLPCAQCGKQKTTPRPTRPAVLRLRWSAGYGSSSLGRQSCVPTGYGVPDAASPALGHRPPGISQVKRHAELRITSGLSYVTCEFQTSCQLQVHNRPGEPGPHQLIAGICGRGRIESHGACSAQNLLAPHSRRYLKPIFGIYFGTYLGRRSLRTTDDKTELRPLSSQ